MPVTLRSVGWAGAVLAAIVTTSGGTPQNLTADHARLLRAINSGDWSTGVSAEAREIAESLATAFGPALGSQGTALTDGRCLCGLCVLDGVTRIADALKG